MQRRHNEHHDLHRHVDADVFRHDFSNDDFKVRQNNDAQNGTDCHDARLVQRHEAKQIGQQRSQRIGAEPPQNNPSCRDTNLRCRKILVHIRHHVECEFQLALVPFTGFKRAFERTLAD